MHRNLRKKSGFVVIAADTKEMCVGKLENRRCFNDFERANLRRIQFKLSARDFPNASFLFDVGHITSPFQRLMKALRQIYIWY